MITRDEMRDRIRTSNDLCITKMEVPEWGGEMYVRSLTALERSIFEDWVREENKKCKEKEDGKELDTALIRAKLIELASCTEVGTRIFEDGDYLWLAQKSSDPIVKVSRKIQDLSGMGVEEQEQAVKNSKTAQGEDSTSE